MMDVDEFLVPAAALARCGLPPAVLLAPRNAAEAEAVRGAMSGLLSQTVALLQQSARQTAGVPGGVGEGRESPSAYKMAWLQFSSHEDAEEEKGGGTCVGGAACRSSRSLTMDRYRRHAAGFTPAPARLLGDNHNGKILARGHVHTDFSGHSATLAPGGAAEASVSILFVAHFIGRRRSYVSTDTQHQGVVNLRRRQVDLGPMTSWKRSPLCLFRLLFRRHVCQVRAGAGGGEPHASGVLKNVSCPSVDGGVELLEEWQACVDDGLTPPDVLFHLS